MENKIMTKILLRGCNGKMGQVVTSIAEQDLETEIVAGIDLNTEQKNSYPVYKTISECPIKADVIIDFSSPSELEELLETAKKQALPIVLCTTGLNEEQIISIEDASKEIAILRSANMSFGVNVLMKLVQEAAKKLTEAGFDIEVIERHHNQKVDAPSGTALAIADAINETLDNQYHYVYDRSKERHKREKNEIGISAIRGGTIVGEHTILFAGRDEVIELKHTAYSKEIFANGAVQAAKFLSGKKSGMYQMSDVTE